MWRSEMDGSATHWQKEDFGVNRRVTTLVERIAVPDEATSSLLVVTKQLYANHYYEGALSVTWIGPAENGDGTMIVHAVWARIDALRGWSLFKGRVRRGVLNGMGERVAAAVARLEAQWPGRPAGTAR